MVHVVLLGDSVIDNKAYVAGGPDVAEQLGAIAPANWRVTRLARDGDVIADVALQLAALPADATHLVVSTGGNDALLESGVLDAPATSTAQALAALAAVRDRFEAAYADMLERVIAAGRTTAVCTIYEPRFEPAQRRLAATALCVLNDAITRHAARRGLTLLDLRVMFDSDADFANPIEPSVKGGAKLADAIRRFVVAPQAGARVIV
jgi:hypothetical protein